MAARIFLTGYPSILGRIYINADESRLQTKLKVRMEQQHSQMLQMVSGLAHNFRTPITVILGYLELMDTENDPVKVTEYMAAMKNRTMQLNTSVNRLYDYFLAGNHENTENQIIDLKVIIPKVLGDLYEFISEYGIEVILNTPCEACTVYADEEMLNRVLENVLINAAKYNTGKTIHIAVNQSKNNDLRICVSNPAAPLSDDDLSRIFELFYRKDPSRHDGSSGIRLSIIKMFVERMGGNVSAEYKDKNFTIAVSLPRK